MLQENFNLSFLIFILVVKSCLGLSTWNLSLNPKIFGGNFQLTCSVNNTSAINSATSLVMETANGEQITNTQLTNQKDAFHRMYDMTSSVFDKTNKSLGFDCEHGTMKYSNLANITLNVFEYKTSQTKDLETVSLEDLFSIRFQNVPTSPKCTVIYGNKDVSNQLHIINQKDIKIVHLPLMSYKNECPLTLKITCDVGTATFVQRLRPVAHSCDNKVPEALHSVHNKDAGEKDQTAGYVGLAIFTVVAIVFVGGFILGLIIKRVSS